MGGGGREEGGEAVSLLAVVYFTAAEHEIVAIFNYKA